MARVFAATVDPNLGGDTPGLAELRAAGVEVQTGPSGARSMRLNEAFERHVRTGLPFVTLKMAASLDGKTAAADGSSRWITGDAARADVQRLRAGADAVVVGGRTAIEDDPALTVRDARFAAARPPLRVVVDTAGRVPATGRLFDGSAPTLVATTAVAPESAHACLGGRGRRDPHARSGCRAATCRSPRCCRRSGKREVQSLLVEGGATLAWSFVQRWSRGQDRGVPRAHLDRGDARRRASWSGEGFAPVSEALALDFDFEEVARVGADLRLEAYVHRDR